MADSAKVYPTISFPDAALITGWDIMVFMIFSVLVRLLTKITKTRKVTLDDYLIAIAMLFSIGQSIATTSQIQYGPGGPKGFSATRFQKSAYAAELLYIPTMAFAKISTAWLLYQITPDLNHQRMVTVLMILTSLWAITTELATAFQCSSPKFSLIFSSGCMNQNALWTYFGIFSIILDVGIMLLPVAILYESQMSLRRKSILVGAFGSRICLVFATIARLVYIHKFSNNLERRHNLWALVICTQVEQNLAVIVATIPYLKPFFESLETGMIGRSAQYSRDRSERYALRSILRKMPSSHTRRDVDGSSATGFRKDFFAEATDLFVNAEAVGDANDIDLRRGGDFSDQMGIRYT